MLKTKYAALFGGCILLSLIISSCKRDKHKVNVEDIQVSLHINRFEQDLFKLNMQNAEEAIPQLEQQYPMFYGAFVQRLMEFGDPDSPATRQRLVRFVSNTNNYKVYLMADSMYHDFSAQQKELEQVFRYFRYHFPDRKIPHLYTYVAPFGYATPYFDSAIAIGLDMFLGADNPIYKTTGMPDYVIRMLDKRNMTRMVARALAYQQFDIGNRDKTLLDHMISEGKVMYFLDAMMPGASDSLKMGYTRNQLKWCEDNEVEIWKHLVDKKMLYSTDYQTFRAYIADAPFTSASDVPPESSPRFVIWVGWQIVKKYMDENPGITLAQLINEPNSAEILRKSAYKPGK